MSFNVIVSSRGVRVPRPRGTYQRPHTGLVPVGSSDRLPPTSVRREGSVGRSPHPPWAGPSPRERPAPSVPADLTNPPRLSPDAARVDCPEETATHLSSLILPLRKSSSFPSSEPGGVPLLPSPCDLWLGPGRREWRLSASCNRWYYLCLDRLRGCCRCCASPPRPASPPCGGPVACGWSSGSGAGA